MVTKAKAAGSVAEAKGADKAEEFLKGNKKTSKAKTPKAPKVAKAAVAGYKDGYSKKEYASKEAFKEMKLKHENTAFTKLYKALLPIVNKGQATGTIDVSKMDLDHIDARLPRYVLGFIEGGEKYKSKNTKFGAKKSLVAIFEVAKAG